MQIPKQLYVFPHAGGSEVSYISLQKQLSSFFDVKIISYPGRGKRISEAFAPNLESLIQDCIKQFEQVNNNSDVYILGHSFGALVAFECLRTLNNMKAFMPKAVFLSGRGAPSEPIKQPLKHQMSDIDLITYLDSIGGIPKELVDNNDFLSFFMPIIRNDLKMNELYQYKEENKLNIPFILLNGKEDKGITPSSITAWQKETSIPMRKILMDGDHFFILNNPTFVTNLITYCQEV